MTWVILCTLLVYVASNLPLIYSLCCTHRLKGVAALWGYSPHQFLFVALIFPFAAFCSFLSIYILYSRVGPLIPADSGWGWFLNNGVPVLIAGLCIASIITVGDYVSSARSVDKLRPQYARRFIAYVQTLKSQIDDLPNDQRADRRERSVREARKAKSELLLPPSSIDQVDATWLKRLQPMVFLQVAQDPALQRRLGLVDAVTYDLSFAQVVVTLFVAVCAAIAVFSCVGLYSSNVIDASIKNSPELQRLSEAAFGAVVFFGFYPIFFHQYRAEIEPLVGSSGTILQHVVAGLAVSLALIVLAAVSFRKEVPDLILTRLLPIFIIIAGFWVAGHDPEILRQIIGTETSIGRQIAFVSLFLAASVGSMILLLIRR